MLRRLLRALVVATSIGVVPLAVPIVGAQSSNGDDAGSATSSPSSPVHMEVHAGFDGAGRVGTWIPLEIDLVNEGPEIRANVEVSTRSGASRGTFASAPTAFSLPVVLPRLSNKRYTMEVLLPSAGNRITARLVRQPGDGLLAERDVTMARVPLGDYFCGVLARDPSSYDFLAALDLPPPIRRIRLAPLDPSTIPERAQLLGSFDCIIIDNAATSQLRQEQLDALQVWTGTGGLLLAVGGATWQSTLGPLPPTLLPVQPGGLTSLNSLSALGDFLGTPLDGSGPWLVTQSRPSVDRGAAVVAAQDGVPLIVAAKRGDGTVIYLGFEPTSQGIRGWAGSDQLWRYLITHASVDNGIGSALVRPYLRWGRVPRIALSDFSTHPKPDLSWLWIIAGGYGLTLGATLFTLGRRGMVGWSVLSTTGLTALAALVAFAFANDRAQPDTAITRLTVIRPIEVGDASAAYTREYFSILARHTGSFSFTLPDDALARGLFFPFPRPADESDASWQLRVNEGAHPVLDKMELKQGQLATATVDGQLRTSPGVQADLRVENGSIVGTMINRTGGRLSDAYLVVDNRFTPLGTLDSDQARQIELSLPDQAGAGNLAATALAERLTPPDAAGTPGAGARRDWLESLFSSRFLFSRMELRGPTLVGWLQQSPRELQSPGLRLSISDFALLVQPLQPQLPHGFEGEVPAAAMNRRDLGIGSGVPTDREFYSVAPGEAVTLQFALPRTEGRFELQQLRLNVEGAIMGRSRFAPAMPFTVSLFNWKAAEWQGWDVGTGASTVPDGARFISAAGEVRMRYTLDTSFQNTVREVRLTRLDVTPVGLVR